MIPATLENLANPKNRRWLCALGIALISLLLLRSFTIRFSALMPNSRNPLSAVPATNSAGLRAEPEILPPIDLTAGDYGDISKIPRDHAIFANGRAAEISPLMNDTRMTGQRIAFEFSNIEERLKALEGK